MNSINSRGFVDSINKMEERSKENKGKETFEIVFKLFVFYILLYIVREGFSIMTFNTNNPFVINFSSFFFVPFIQMVVEAGLYVGLINYFLKNRYFNVSSYRMHFKHVKNVLILAQFFLVFLVKVVVEFISFFPAIYLFKDVVPLGIDPYNTPLSMIEEDLFLAVLTIFIGFVLSRFIMDSFIAYYYTITYNSLDERYSGFFWNVKWSVKEYFKNKSTLRDVLFTEISFSFVLVLMTAVLLVFNIKISLNMDIATIINMTYISKGVLLVFMAFVDAIRIYSVARAISFNIAGHSSAAELE